MNAPEASLPLPPALIVQLGQHHLAPSRRVRGRFSGAHRSTRFGSSADVADVRRYVAGDDLRRIDRAASRRHGKLQVALTEAEDDAAAQVVVDRSASMRGPKAAVADRLVAGLALLGARDGVRLWLVGTARGPSAGGGAPTGAVVRDGWARGQRALASTSALLASVPVPAEAAAPAGRPDLAGAVARAAASGAGGPLLLVTDLLFDGWEAVVTALGAARRDAVVLQVLADEELHPTLDGDVRLVDVETGAEVEVGADARTLAAYADALEAHLTAVERRCTGVRVAHVVVPSSTDPADVLLGELRRVGVVR